MAHIIIRSNIVRNVNPHDLAYRIPKLGGCNPLVLQNGDVQYETSEANRDNWDSLNESSQEVIFRRYFHEHIDLEDLIEENKKKRKI